MRPQELAILFNICSNIGKISSSVSVATLYEKTSNISTGKLLLFGHKRGLIEEGDARVRSSPKISRYEGIKGV